MARLPADLWRSFRRLVTQFETIADDLAKLRRLVELEIKRDYAGRQERIKSIRRRFNHVQDLAEVVETELFGIGYQIADFDAKDDGEGN